MIDSAKMRVVSAANISYSILCPADQHVPNPFDPLIL